MTQTVPTSTAGITSASEAIPHGFEYRNPPPGAGTPTNVGFIIQPTNVNTVAVLPTTRTGRHRREGNVPVGKKNNMKASAGALTTNCHSDIAPTSSGPGSAPGCVAIPRMAYADVRDMTEKLSPTPNSIHPITLRARRTISVPSAAYTMPAIDVPRFG